MQTVRSEINYFNNNSSHNYSESNDNKLIKNKSNSVFARNIS